MQLTLKIFCEQVILQHKILSNIVNLTEDFKFLLMFSSDQNFLYFVLVFFLCIFPFTLTTVIQWLLMTEINKQKHSHSDSLINFISCRWKVRWNWLFFHFWTLFSILQNLMPNNFDKSLENAKSNDWMMRGWLWKRKVLCYVMRKPINYCFRDVARLIAKR